MRITKNTSEASSEGSLVFVEIYLYYMSCLPQLSQFGRIERITNKHTCFQTIMTIPLKGDWIYQIGKYNIFHIGDCKRRGLML